MRITVHLGQFDHVDPRAYAILWLDDALLEWSREAHFRLSLPSWGRLRTDAGITLVCGPDGVKPVFALEGMAFGVDGGPFEGEAGIARWYADDSAKPESGHWIVQCVDDQQTLPESSVFADDVA